MKDRYLFKAKRLDNGEWDAIAGIPENVSILTDTICQCTGLKDENDKLIWENDIIRCKVGTAKVIWDKSEWRIEWLKNDLWRKDLYYWAVEDIQRTVVIGNIFDNKELLESEEK